MSDKMREAFERWKRSEDALHILQTTMIDPISCQSFEAGYQARQDEIDELKDHVAREQLWRKETTDYLASMYGDFSRVAVTNEFLAAHDDEVCSKPDGYYCVYAPKEATKREATYCEFCPEHGKCLVCGSTHE